MSDTSPPPDAATSEYASRRELLAWASYDWANSAFSTLSITILVAYLEQIVFAPDEWGHTGDIVWAWGISLSMLCAAILSPLFGAMADARANKRGWLAGSALSGATAAILLAVVPPDRVWVLTGLFFAANLGFELSLGFYNGFLPELANEEQMNRVSSWGYGLGYVGGGAALLVAIGILKLGSQAGIDSTTLLRANLALMGLWWGLFSLPALWILRDRGEPVARRTGLMAAARAATADVVDSIRHLRRYKTLAIFLLAFLFYNDGIQTVISQSSTFALEELRFNESELIGVILMIQFLALPGALLVGWLADRYEQKRVLVATLVIWISLLIAAYLIETKPAFWVLGALVALVLGGTQSLSRSVMGVMTPRQHTAKFFGFFNLSGKATSFLGTFLFGLIIWRSGNIRLAIASLLVFFLAGLLLLGGVDIARGRQDKLKV